MEGYKKEYELYLDLLKSYPNCMNNTLSFNEFIKDSISYIEGQLEDMYIDINNGSMNEMSFLIIVESLKLYKEKHNIK